MDPVSVFATLARDFCAWCESTTTDPDIDSQAAVWLCSLYAAVLALPQAEPDDCELAPLIPDSSSALAASKLSAFNGWYYREYFDPHPLLDDESGMGDVGDDLIDIYKDIRRGLLVFENGQVRNAVWHWRFHHRIHWGRHAVGALFALHCMAISKLD